MFKIILENNTLYKIENKFFDKYLFEENIDKDIEVIMVYDEQMQEINSTQRGIDKTTDTLSFPFESMPNAPFGAIIISLDKAKAQALHLGHSIEDELALLFIHSFLHLLGFDHETDNGEQRAKEAELIERFSLPSSLIDRNLK